MENMSIMNILSMLSGAKNAQNGGNAAEADKGTSPFGLGGLLNSLQKGGTPQAEPPEKKSEPPRREEKGERVKIDVNPLISAMKSHDEFIKRVNENQKKNKP